MSTTPEQLPAFDRLDDPGMYDDKGMVIPPAKVDEGDSGSSATPPASDAAVKTATGDTENTAATPPSPDAKPAPVVEPPPAEDKSGQAAKTTTEADAGKPPTAPPAKDGEEETEDQLKARLARPTDTGDEWRIRAYREGQTLRKKLSPILTQMERIASPERASRGLDFVAEFGDPDVEIADAVEKMTALSSSRTRELSNFFYETFLDHYPDLVATDLIGEVDEQGNPVPVTATELKEALKLVRSGATAGSETTQPQSTATGAAVVNEPAKPDGMSADDWENFKLDYPDVFKAMQAQVSVAQPPPAPAPAKEDPKVAELTSKLSDIERQQLERQQETLREEILTKGNEFHTQAFSVVEDGLRDLGLIPDPAKDDDRTIRLKNDTANSIRAAVDAELDGPDGPNGNMDWSLCSTEQKENRKLAVKIMSLLSQRDYTAAFDYLDLAKARYDLAFQRVAEPKIELYNAAMGQSSTSNRNVGQEGHKRPEIVDGSATAAASNGQNKTPWLDPGFKRPDETVWEAMDRYMETHGVPARQ